MIVLLAYAALGVFGLILLAWLAGMLFVNDFTVPGRAIGAFRKVLVIFPHADDEVNMAGLLWRLGRQGTVVTLVILTKGERGNPTASFDPALKAIRTREARSVSRLLGVTRLIQEDFGDGELAGKRGILRAYLDRLIIEHSPDLVITYDLAGMYGHEDHMVCADLVTRLVKAKCPNTALWHLALPRRLVSVATLAEHMAKDSGFRTKRAVASHKIWSGYGLAAKLRALYAYQSQRQSARSAVPYRLPLWFAFSMLIFEYFEEVR